jgi:hypothetical protein
MVMSKYSYLSLFKCRGDTYCEQQADGSYIRIMRPPTESDLDAHLNHDKTLAFYLAMNNLCFTGCLDFDLPKSERDNKTAHVELQTTITAAYELLSELGVTSLLVESTGGRGYHLWAFSELVSTSLMYGLLRRISDAVCAEAEVFPIDSQGLGKAIRPPLGTHRVFGGSSMFVDPWTFEEIEVTDEDARILDENRIKADFYESVGIHEVVENTKRIDSQFSYESVPKAADFQEVFESLRPCFRGVHLSGIDTSGGQGWSFMTAAAAEIYANGGKDEDVHEFFRPQAQYHPKETRKHLAPIKRKNLLPFRCSRLQDQCSDYVLEYCAECHVMKQHTLSEKIDEVVDRTQGKESRNEGDIGDTLEQFKCVAMDLNDAMSGGEYTMITNPFNSGKSWTTIGFLKHTIHTEGHRVNFIAPTKKIKALMIERMRQAEINFIDNPSNMDLCPRAATFKKLGYVPTMVCKKCSAYKPIQKLVKPIFDDYVEDSDKPMFADIKYFEQVADRYDTCAKWAYLATLEATKEHNMVMLMTAEKLKHHFFIPDSPLIPAMSSPVTFCNIIDQIDFVNRNIPKIKFSEKEVYNQMRQLGMVCVEDMDDAMLRIEDALEKDDLEIEDLDDMAAMDNLRAWLRSQKMFDEGVLRRVSNKQFPGMYSYDFMGEREVKFILNDIIGKRINPKLYDNTFKYIENLTIDTYDGIARVPKSFREILEDFTGCTAILGITSTPSELECMNSHWLSKYHDCSGSALKNLYSMPHNIQLDETRISDDRTIIFSRKQVGEDFINDGQVRGNTGTGGKRDEVIIKAFQYPKHSESVIGDLIQLCGGNFAKGIKAFYEGIVGDALTQANKYDAEKIIVPNPEIFRSLGFDLKIHDDITMGYWKEFLNEKIGGAGFVYRQKFASVPDYIVDMLVENEFLNVDGKRYSIN